MVTNHAGVIVVIIVTNHARCWVSVELEEGGVKYGCVWSHDIQRGEKVGGKVGGTTVVDIEPVLAT